MVCECVLAHLSEAQKLGEGSGARRDVVRGRLNLKKFCSASTNLVVHFVGDYWVPQGIYCSSLSAD